MHLYYNSVNFNGSEMEQFVFIRMADFHFVLSKWKCARWMNGRTDRVLYRLEFKQNIVNACGAHKMDRNL